MESNTVTARNILVRRR